MVTDLSSTKRYYTDYLTGFQYSYDEWFFGGTSSVVLSFFPHQEGYVNNRAVYTNPWDRTPSSYVYEYVYNHTDHLGNVRLSYRKNGTSTQILEENNYYPFGLKHKGYNDNNYSNGYKYKYQGQERQDELGLNWDSFKWRNYDYAIGRFMSIDPLSEKYVYNGVYNFSENRVVNSRELEGLEAWESIRLWDNDDVKKYGEFVSKQAENYRTNGIQRTCEDFALSTLIDYASENGLPIQITNGTGVYNSQSSNYTDVETFRNDVLVTTGAKDLQNNQNTTKGNINNLSAGDILLKRNDGVNANHVQVVSKIEDVGNGKKNTHVEQGNSGVLNKIPGASRLLGASNPQSIFYTGVLPQQGTYLNSMNSDYVRYEKNIFGAKSTATHDTGPAKNYNLEVRKWNFTYWNSLNQ